MSLVIVAIGLASAAIALIKLRQKEMVKSKVSSKPSKKVR